MATAALLDRGSRRWTPRLRALPAGPAPLLGPRLAISDRPDVHLWQTELRLATHPFLAQHRLQGAVVVPGSVYVEAALEAARQVMGDGPITLRDVAFVTPLTLSEERGVLVEVSLLPLGAGRWSFRWSSLAGAADAASPEWIVHATAEVRAGSAPDAGDAEPLSEVRARCTRTVSPAELDRVAKKMDLDVGPAFRTVRGVRTQPGEVLADVGLPDGASSGFLVHPAMLDAGVRALLAGGPADGSRPQILAGIREVHFHAQAVTDVLVHGRILASDSAGTEARARVVASTGEPIVTLEGVRARRISSDLLVLRSLKDVLFGVEWKPVALGEARSPAPGTWLVLGDSGGVGEALAAALTERGLSVKLVLPAGAATEGQASFIDFTDPVQIASAVREAASSSALLAGVVHLAALGAEPETAVGLLQAQERACGSALSAVKALIDQGITTAQLFLVTRGTQAVGRAPGALEPTGATVWGLGRSIANEHPELRCTRIDLAPGAGPAGVESLADELLSGANEDEVTLRPAGRYVSRLTRGRLPTTSGDSPVRADATYLITGGLGGLGLVAAEELASQGAKHLVLTGRGGVRTAGQREVVDRLSSAGVDVVVAQADMASEADVARVLADIAARMPPLRGVLHTAGVLSDGLLLNQTWGGFAKVFAPKVIGAFNLHRATLGMPLDFFVLYSSMSGLLAPPGVSSYVAANVYLDSLAHARRAAGLVATSVDWGLFAELGMGLKATASAQSTTEALDGFTPQQGAALLGVVLRSGFTQAGLGVVNLEQLTTAYPTLAKAPRLSGLTAASRGAGPAAGRGAEELATLRRIAGASGAERTELVAQAVRAQLGRILRIDPARLDMGEPLGNHGFDSLMGMELRNWLDRTLRVKMSMADIVANAQGDTLVGLVAARLPDLEELPTLESAVPASAPTVAVAGPASTPSVVFSSSPAGSVPPGPISVRAPALPASDRPPGSWVVVPKPSDAARIRLFCFPYAGGSASVFAGWPAELPPEIEMCAIQYPGRHERLHEPLPRSVDEIVSELVPAMLPYLDRPFATFGHCLGAIVMFEALRQLAEKHGKKAVHVFASGAPAPKRYLVPSVAGYSPDEFTGLLRALGFANESVLTDPDAAEHLLPAVRSDFNVAAGYAYSEGPPLDAPITGFAGLTDGFAPSGVVDDWRMETTSRFQRIAFPGGHYFIVPERAPLLGHVGSELLLRLAALDQRAAAGVSADRWVVRSEPARSPRLRLFCFPGVGQSSADYAWLRGAFGADIEVCLIEPPGRGDRAAELPLGRALEIGRSAARAILPLSDRPFAFFGHDLGALAMFEAVRSLHREEAPEPIHLVVSAAMSPDLHYFAPIHHLPADAFRAEIARLGIDRKLPERTVRADCAVLSSYVFKDDEPFDIPLTVVAAERDALVPMAGVRAWRGRTRRESTLLVRSGGHTWSEMDRPILEKVSVELLASVARWEAPTSREQSEVQQAGEDPAVGQEEDLAAAG
ncbi:MAG: SDR family NAD(P)-dependent oxidoreductase [Polyangiaceae bacterium]